MKASDIIERFGAWEDDKRATGYRAFCPCHEKDGGHSPSLILDFNSETHRALVHCQSRGCEYDEILVAVGLSARDMADVSYIGQSLRSMSGAAVKAPATSEARRTVAGEAYRFAAQLSREVSDNPTGAVASLLRDKYGIDTDRLSTADADTLGVGLTDEGRVSITARTGSEEVAFQQYRATDDNDPMRWTMPRNPDDRTRFDAAGFVGRRHAGGPLVVCEGSSDALTLAALDAYDVVAIRGARNAARVAEVAGDIVGRDLVLLVDNDEAGRHMTTALLTTLSPIAGRVSYARFPKGYDVGDVRAENPATFRERLQAHIADAKAYEPKIDFDYRPYLAGSDSDRAEALVAFARAQGLDLAWTPSHGWLVFDGTVWNARAEARVWQLSAALGKHLRKTASKESKKKRKKVVKAQARMFLSANPTRLMLAVAQSQPGVLMRADDFDANPDVLAVGNGVVDLRTGDLRPMRAEDRITRRLAVTYRPEASAPRWEQFLREMLVSDDGQTAHDVVEYVTALVGYGITGHTSEQMFTLMTGTGANGKSVFLNVLGDVFGEVAQRTPFSTFEQKSGSAIPNDVAMLKGARLVMASESDVNAKMSESMLKAVTGEDVISARFMRAEWFEFRPAFQLFLATNHLPRFISQDNGIWRRVRLIEWKREMVLHEQDRGLAQRIVEEEAEGVLVWAVRASAQWYANGRRLPKSETVETASLGYKEDSDVLGDFLSANVLRTHDRKDVAFMSDLHERFLFWQETHGEQLRPGRTTFSRMLGERWGNPPRTAKPKHWKGYRLLSEAEVRQNTLTDRADVVDGSYGSTPQLVVPEPTTAAKHAGKFRLSGPSLSDVGADESEARTDSN